MPHDDQLWASNEMIATMDRTIPFLPDWADSRPRRRLAPPPIPAEPEPPPEDGAVPCVAEVDAPLGPHVEMVAAAPPTVGVGPEPERRGPAGLPLALVAAASIFGGGLAVALLDRTVALPGVPTVTEASLKSEIAGLTALIEAERRSSAERERTASASLAERLAGIERALKSPPEVAALAELHGLGRRIDGLEQDAQKLQPIPGLVEVVRKDLEQGVDKLQKDLALIRAEAHREAKKPAEYGDADPSDVLYKRGVALFERKEYAAAREVFLGLTEIAPSDARTWYFAALATALVTNDWAGGATATLFREGNKRETDGTPDRAQIDAAFASLDQACGRDWLAFYRPKTRASTRP